jgi:hypothetical protein
MVYHSRGNNTVGNCTRLIGSPTCAGNAKLRDILMQIINLDTHLVSLIIAKRRILERTILSGNWRHLGFPDIDCHIRPCLFVSKFMQSVTSHHFPNAGRVRVGPSKEISSET